MESNKDVVFKNDKHLTFIKNLGKGGTGEVKLFYDSEIDRYFAIKKFVPPVQHVDDYYVRFKNEIKILVDVFHPNIVRCYTYYLYPKQKTGFLQMEYIQGETIIEYLAKNPDRFDKLLYSAISAFEYLEGKGIIHRDVRPNNFLVSGDELKIIDFGFGKDTNADSVSKEYLRLNWPVTIAPEEIANGNDYDSTTEVYYVGYMFRKLLGNSNRTSYRQVIDKMCEISRARRYSSFHQAKTDMMSLLYDSTSFSEDQRKAYASFVDPLIDCISNTYSGYSFNDVDTILKKLEENVRINALEKYVTNNSKLISSFIEGGFSYHKRQLVSVASLKAFYSWLMSESKERRDVIVSNIENRFSNVACKADYFADELPF